VGNEATRFKPGQSGNPGGRPKNLVTNQLRELLTEDKAQGILEKLIGMAQAGNLQAAQYIIDRLDGKPVQALEHSGPEGKPIVHVRGPKEKDAGDRKQD
jgi:hypothetical protein